MTQTVVAPDAREDTRTRIESAALDLFTAQGFEQVTIDEIADAAGISRRTFFRYVGAKADAVWGDFDAHVPGWRRCWRVRRRRRGSRCWRRSAPPTSRSTTTPRPTCRCSGTGCG